MLTGSNFGKTLVEVQPGYYLGGERSCASYTHRLELDLKRMFTDCSGKFG